MPGKVRNLDLEFVPESGCPVAMVTGRGELDLDPFDVPIDARIYIDYKNNSDRAISAVKFRIRFMDFENNDRGTFHAPDMELLAPGATGNEKWKHDRVDPRATSIKVRILQVKYQDGSNWLSAKMSELPEQYGGAGGGGTSSGRSQQNSGSIIPDVEPVPSPPAPGSQAPPATGDPFSGGAGGAP